MSECQSQSRAVGVIKSNEAFVLWLYEKRYSYLQSY